MRQTLTFWLRRAWVNLRGEVLVLPSRTLVLAWTASLLLLPLVYPDPYVLRVLALTCLFAIFAASWDLLGGYAGQINFGHSLFFGVGAYGSSVLCLRLGLSPWLTVFIGAGLAALSGVASAFICLRLRGSYLSLATLAFPLILTGLLFAFPDFSGGELGISGIASLAASRTANYYICACAMLVVVFGLAALADSKFGLVLHAIRDDEIAVRASGLNTTRYKLAAFAISGAAAGLAGALFAHLLRVAGPSTLELALSFQVVIWGVFGGLATIYGPVAAVFILYPLTEWLGSFRQFGELRLLIFALVVLVVLLAMPRGLAPWVRDKIEMVCARCKQRNIAWRTSCRLCGAPAGPRVDGVAPAAAAQSPR